ncbi:molybdopterin dinucleotide binding domain-containing protein [Methanothrix soehngenii]|jgi:formylmethanofuran dehydrogenase subunit D|uniref:molybdopterin dinucleotide binding domain-containing protein n=1 Tax=Methanothrix soehngenii TaxID=2223 RepID=UPI0031437417
MAVDVKVVTYRDIFQYGAEKMGLHSEEYLRLSASIILDKGDMASLGIAEGGKVLLENELNRVVLNATASADKPHPGLVFMIKSPWSNQLEGDESCPAGASGFRGIQAQISPSSESITQMDEILQRLRA